VADSTADDPTAAERPRGSRRRPT